MDYKKKNLLITCNVLLFTGNVHCLTLTVDGKISEILNDGIVSFNNVRDDNSKLLELLQAKGYITKASDYEISNKELKIGILKSQ